MFYRILLGGTHEQGVGDFEPNREAEARIVAQHAKIFSQMRV